MLNMQFSQIYSSTPADTKFNTLQFGETQTLGSENWAFKSKLWGKHNVHLALQNYKKIQGCLFVCRRSSSLTLEETFWDLLCRPFRKTHGVVTILKECTWPISHLWLPLTVVHDILLISPFLTCILRIKFRILLTCTFKDPWPEHGISWTFSYQDNYCKSPDLKRAIQTSVVLVQNGGLNGVTKAGSSPCPVLSRSLACHAHILALFPSSYFSSFSYQFQSSCPQEAQKPPSIPHTTCRQAASCISSFGTCVSCDIGYRTDWRQLPLACPLLVCGHLEDRRKSNFTW